MSPKDWNQNVAIAYEPIIVPWNELQILALKGAKQRETHGLQKNRARVKQHEKDSRGRLRGRS